MLRTHVIFCCERHTSCFIFVWCGLIWSYGGRHGRDTNKILIQSCEVSHSNGTGGLGADAARTLGFRWGVHVNVSSRVYGRDRHALRQQRAAVAARVLFCTLYCWFPSQHMYFRTSEMAISTAECFQYSMNGWWRNQRGHKQVKHQLKQMNITQTLAFCPATTAVWSESDWNWLPRGLNESYTRAWCSSAWTTRDDNVCPPAEKSYAFFYGMRGNKRKK